MFFRSGTRTPGLAATLLTAAGCIPAGPISTIEATGPASFPNIVGTNLEGQEIALPEGFEGSRNLVAVAFERNQQRSVDSWIAVADRIAPKTPGLRFYELPTIYEGNALFRTWVNNGMRVGIQDPIARERTITVYLDRQEFMKTLEIPNESEIHVFLLNESGRILWRTTGSSNAEKQASLEAALLRGI